MKKLTFLMLAVLACLLQVNAQQFVSTSTQNRNAIIEEFTGRNCGYCPDGHVIANNIVHSNPGRVWAVNVMPAVMLQLHILTSIQMSAMLS